MRCTQIYQTWTTIHLYAPTNTSRYFTIIQEMEQLTHTGYLVKKDTTAQMVLPYPLGARLVTFVQEE